MFFNILGRKLTWVVENEQLNEVTMKASTYSKFDRHRERDNEDEEDENRELNPEDRDPSFVAIAKEMKRDAKGQAGTQGTNPKTRNADLSESEESFTNSASDTPKIIGEIESTQEPEASETYSDPMDAEKEEMRRIERDFEEKTARLAPMLTLPETVTNLK